MLAVVLSAINFVVLVTLHARTLICSYMFFFAQVFGTFLRTTGEKSYHSFICYRPNLQCKILSFLSLNYIG